MATPPPKRKKSLWRRLRRATRRPRNWLLARGIYVVARAVGILPVPVALGLGRALGTAAHALLGTPRRLARTHVGLAFPELGATACNAIVQETFRHAGQSYAELALWPKLARDPDYVRIENRAALDDALAQGRGCLAITGHVGNWELLAARIASLGYGLSVVARRVNDERFDALITRFRGRAGMEILLRDDPQFLGTVRDALGRGRIVALLIDQDSAGGGVFVPFFGRPAHTPPGAAILALRIRVPAVSVFIHRRPDGGHVIRFAPFGIDSAGGAGKVTDLTARFTRTIEDAIREAPAEWVWWHERWRRRPEP
ncbi:MAG: lysophospholipid acyltransferase family protein [Candidatus Binatia bacterium]